MRSFYYLKLAQGLACFLIFCFSISTTELHGRFTEKLATIFLMESCDTVIIYKSTHPPPKNIYSNNNDAGVTRAKRDDLGSGGNGQTSAANSAGRILTVFDTSTVRSTPNSTDEMKMRVLLLFEWNKSNLGPVQLPPIGNYSDMDLFPFTEADSENNITSQASDDKVVNIGLRNHSSSSQLNNASDVDGVGVYFPNGSQSYQISKLDAFSANEENDPFQQIEGRLFLFTLLSLVQLFSTALQAILKDKHEEYTFCELAYTMLSFVEWIVVFSLAVEMCVIWDSLWNCTNYRPERPSVFVQIAVLSAFLVMLYITEAVYNDEPIVLEQRAQQGVLSAATSTYQGRQATTVSLPPTKKPAVYEANERTLAAADKQPAAGNDANERPPAASVAEVYTVIFQNSSDLK